MPLPAAVLGLEGASALVVGGGSGIGRAAARLLAQAGALVTVADVDQGRADAVCDELGTFGRSGRAVGCDVTKEPEAERAVAAATEFGSGLDVMINIVGQAAWSSLFDLDQATWDLDMQRNLVHHLYVARAAARQMRHGGRGGRMALVASVSALYGPTNHAAYGVAKAGVVALCRAMANEWAEYGIRVNAVAPDGINTPRVVQMRNATGTNTDEEARRRGFPLGRFGRPEEIAGPLLFLVSELSSYMTGQLLVVDGGRQGRFPSAAPSM